MSLVRNFVLGSAIGFGALALPNSTQAQNKPENIQEKELAERQKELNDKRERLHHAINDAVRLFDKLKNEKVPEIEFQAAEEACEHHFQLQNHFIRDEQNRLSEIKAEIDKAIKERIEKPDNKREIIIPITAGISVVSALLLILVISKGPVKNKQNFLGENIGEIDLSKPIDTDKALKKLKEFRDKQNLLPEEQTETKEILTKLISILEKIKQINDKGNLTIGDKPKLAEIYSELYDVLRKLEVTLKSEPDLKNELTLSQWQEFFTGIKVLKN